VGTFERRVGDSLPLAVRPHLLSANARGTSMFAYAPVTRTSHGHAEYERRQGVPYGGTRLALTGVVALNDTSDEQHERHQTPAAAAASQSETKVTTQECTLSPKRSRSSTSINKRVTRAVARARQAQQAQTPAPNTMLRPSELLAVHLTPAQQRMGRWRHGLHVLASVCGTCARACTRHCCRCLVRR
jgi:hypothetical protein